MKENNDKMKNKIDLEIAVKLLTATKGKKNTGLILRDVFDEIQKIKYNRKG